MTPKTHDLKTHPAPFEAVWRGDKRYEIRKNDRDFRVGDMLHLREWNPASGLYTGREKSVAVTYMTLGGEWGLPQGLCVMSIAELPSTRVDTKRRQADVSKGDVQCPARRGNGGDSYICCLYVEGHGGKHWHYGDVEWWP